MDLAELPSEHPAWVDAMAPPYPPPALPAPGPPAPAAGALAAVGGGGGGGGGGAAAYRHALPKGAAKLNLSMLTNRYKLEECLGGHIGEAWLAVDTEWPRAPSVDDNGVAIPDAPKKVVIKRLPVCVGNPVQSVRAIREIGLLHKLRGTPNVLQLEGVLPFRTPSGAADDKGFTEVYIVTEAMTSDLRKTQQMAHLYLSPEHVRWHAYQFLKGVALAHELGVTHRDIAPKNVFIDASNGIRVGDWGHARSAEATAAGPATVYAVTREYRAPELLRAGAAAASPRDAKALRAPYKARPVDAWSVGCVLAEMAAACSHNLVHEMQCSASGADDFARRLPAKAKGEALASLRERRLAYAASKGAGAHAEAVVALKAMMDGDLPKKDDTQALFPGASSVFSPVAGGGGGGGGGGGDWDQLATIGRVLAELETRVGASAGPAQLPEGWLARFPGAPLELLAITRGLLQPDPAARFTVKAALKHPWFDSIPGRASVDAELAAAGQKAQRPGGGDEVRAWEDEMKADTDEKARKVLLALVGHIGPPPPFSPPPPPPLPQHPPPGAPGAGLAAPAKKAAKAASAKKVAAARQ